LIFRELTSSICLGDINFNLIGALICLNTCFGAGGVDGCGGGGGGGGGGGCGGGGGGGCGIVASVVPAAAVVKQTLLSCYSKTFCGLLLDYEIK